jgi:DNA-binding transcriptional ArsR family regulator
MTQFSQKQMLRVVSRARALADPTRLRILLVIARGERAVGQIAAALSVQQSTVSKHLQVLFNAGLVDRRRSASAVIYSADAVHLDRILVLMSKEQRQRKRIDSAHDTHTIRSWKRSR